MVKFVSYSTSKDEEHKLIVRWREDGAIYALCDTIDEAKKIQKQKKRESGFSDIYDVDKAEIYC